MRPAAEERQWDSLAEALLDLLRTSPKAQKVVRDIIREDHGGEIPT